MERKRLGKKGIVKRKMGMHSTQKLENAGKNTHNLHAGQHTRAEKRTHILVSTRKLSFHDAENAALHASLSTMRASTRTPMREEAHL
eukprot:6196325-Pleurochrysis_carterae.AAC.2